MQSWLITRYYPGLHLERLRKTMQNLPRQLVTQPRYNLGTSQIQVNLAQWPDLEVALNTSPLQQFMSIPQEEQKEKASCQKEYWSIKEEETKEMHGAYQVVSGLNNWLFKVLMPYKIISRLPTYILTTNQPTNQQANKQTNSMKWRSS